MQTNKLQGQEEQNCLNYIDQLLNTECYIGDNYVKKFSKMFSADLQLVNHYRQQRRWNDIHQLLNAQFIQFKVLPNNLQEKIDYYLMSSIKFMLLEANLEVGNSKEGNKLAKELDNDIDQRGYLKAFQQLVLKQFEFENKVKKYQSSITPKNQENVQNLLCLQAQANYLIYKHNCRKNKLQKGLICLEKALNLSQIIYGLDHNITSKYKNEYDRQKRKLGFEEEIDKNLDTGFKRVHQTKNMEIILPLQQNLMDVDQQSFKKPVKKHITIVPSDTKEVYFQASYISHVQKRLQNNLNTQQSQNTKAFPTQRTQLATQSTKLRTENNDNSRQFNAYPTPLKISTHFHFGADLTSSRSAEIANMTARNFAFLTSRVTSPQSIIPLEVQPRKIEELMSARPQSGVTRTLKLKLKIPVEEAKLVRKGGGGALSNYDPVKSSKSIHKSRQFLLRQKTNQVSDKIPKMSIQLQLDSNKIITIDSMININPTQPLIPLLPIGQTKARNEISQRSINLSPIVGLETPPQSEPQSYLNQDNPIDEEELIEKLDQLIIQNLDKELNAVKLIQTFFRPRLNLMNQRKTPEQNSQSQEQPSQNQPSRLIRVSRRQSQLIFANRNMFATLMEDLGMKKSLHPDKDHEQDLIDKVEAIIQLLQTIGQISKSFNQITQYCGIDQINQPQWRLTSLFCTIFSPIKSSIKKMNNKHTSDSITMLQEEYPHFQNIIQLWRSNYQSHNALFTLVLIIELNNKSYQLRLNLKNIELFALKNKDSLLVCPIELVNRLMITYYDQNKIMQQTTEIGHFIQIKQLYECCQNLELEEDIVFIEIQKQQRKLMQLIYPLLQSQFILTRTINGTKLRKIQNSTKHILINKSLTLENLRLFKLFLRKQLFHLPNIYIQYFETKQQTRSGRSVQKKVYIKIPPPSILQFTSIESHQFRIRSQYDINQSGYPQDSVKENNDRVSLKDQKNKKLQFFQTRSMNQLLFFESLQESPIRQGDLDIQSSENSPKSKNNVSKNIHFIHQSITEVDEFTEHVVKWKYNHFKVQNYFRLFVQIPLEFKQQFNPIQELEPIHAQLIQYEDQQTIIILRCQFDQQVLYKDYTIKQVITMLKGNIDIGELSLDLKLTSSGQIANKYSFQQFGVEFSIDPSLILKDLFQRRSLTKQVHVALSQALEYKLQQTTNTSINTLGLKFNISIIPNNKKFEQIKSLKISLKKKIRYFTFKKKNGQGHVSVVFKKLKYGVELMIYTQNSVKYVILNNTEQIKTLNHIASLQLNKIGQSMQSNYFMGFIKNLQTPIGKKAQILTSSGIKHKFNYQLSQHTASFIYLFALKCILSSNLEQFKTIFVCYFDVTLFTTTKRIKNLKGITKIDSTLYQLKKTDYKIMVVKLIPLGTRTIRYTLVLNHNDLKTINISHLPFQDQVIQLKDQISTYSSNAYKSIEIVEQDNQHFSLTNKIRICHLKNPEEQIVNTSFLKREIKNNIVIYKKTKCINSNFVIITVEMDTIRNLIFHTIYVPTISKFFRCQFSFRDIEQLQILETIFPIMILENQHLLSQHKSYLQFQQDLTEIICNPRYEGHISRLDIFTDESHINIHQSEIKSSNILTPQDLLPKKNPLKKNLTSRTFVRSKQPHKFSSLILLPRKELNSLTRINHQTETSKNYAISLNKNLWNSSKMVQFYFWDNLLNHVDIEMNQFNKYIYVIDGFRGIIRQYLINQKYQIDGISYSAEVFYDQEQLEWGSMFERNSFITLKEQKDIQIFFKFQNIHTLESFNYKIPLRQLVYNYGEGKTKDVSTSETIQLLFLTVNNLINQIQKKDEEQVNEITLPRIEKESLQSIRSNQFIKLEQPYLKLFSCYKFIYQCILLPRPQVIVTLFLRVKRQTFHFYVEDCSNSLQFIKKLHINQVSASIPHISDLLRLNNNIDLGERLVRTYKNTLIIEIYTKFYSI